MDETSALEIVRWHYDPPSDIYDLAEDEETLRYVLDSKNRFYVMRDEDDGLAGYCSFSEDGQVPGGDYTSEALDIGLGIRPDLTGRGRGADYVTRVLDFARKEFDPACFRVTIAAFNKRAQKVWEKAGFHPVQRFTNIESGLEFMVLIYNVRM